MSEKDVKSWVSSQLHELLGFSEGAVASLVLSLAKKHTSAASLATSLKQNGLPGDARTHSFAGELLARLVPTRAGPSGPSAEQRRAQEQRALLKKNATYTLVEETAEERLERNRQLEASTSGRPGQTPAGSMGPPPPRGPQQQPEQQGDGGGRQQRHLRKGRAAGEEQDDGDGDDGGGAGVLAQHSKRQKRSWEEDEDQEESMEARAERLAQAARDKDQREKEEFEERLRRRDEERTKKHVPEEQRMSKAEQKEAAKRK